jgi:hypothetical protein
MEVLTMDDEETRSHREWMLALLRQVIPRTGVPNAPVVRPLGDKLYELRKQPKGPKLRVPFFYDEENRRVIVCTHAFFKDQRVVPEEVQRAKKLRKQYYEAIRRNNLRIADLPPAS